MLTSALTAAGGLFAGAALLGALLVSIRRGGLREAVDVQEKTIKELKELMGVKDLASADREQHLRDRLANLEGQLSVLRSDVVESMAGAIAEAVVRALAPMMAKGSA